LQQSKRGRRRNLKKKERKREKGKETLKIKMGGGW